MLFVMRLAFTNQSALFQDSVVMLRQHLLMTLSPDQFNVCRQSSVKLSKYFAVPKRENFRDKRKRISDQKFADFVD